MPEITDIYSANTIKLQKLSVMSIREYVKTCHCFLPIAKQLTIWSTWLQS